MHLWSLKLLCPMIKEEMHLQENTLNDLDLVVKATQNVVQYPPNHMNYAPAKFEVATSNSLREDGFTKKVNYVTLTLGPRSHKMLLSTIHIMWPMHLRTLKLLCPMVQEEMQFQVNTLFDRDPGHMKCCLVPSTSCDLCTGKIWSCYFQKFMRRCIYKKIHYLTSSLGSRSHEVLPSTLDIMWPMHRQNLKFLLPKVYEEMHLQENTIFHTKWHPVPSSSCDLCIYKV